MADATKGMKVAICGDVQALRQAAATLLGAKCQRRSAAWPDGATYRRTLE